ncbi:MAG: excinuclease ABC subunit UvrA [Negativicutes bacterium]|nr:excinuclease ABC subunit UvrA [Negativicutes bacterium]
MNDKIIIRGARQHNLKNINVELPRNKFIVFTGLSGSGKSSLAFDTIYAEGQRRYVESLSSYARQFLGQMEKPDVDMISGLSPAISIDQKTTSKNPRSTVATVTEIYDYMRLLYARVGQPYCPNCGKKISQQTVEQIVDQVMSLPPATRLQILAPLVRGRKGEYTKLFEDMRKEGYVRMRVDGTVFDLGDEIKLAKTKKHTLEVVVDRLVLREDIQQRLADSVEAASNLAGGLVIVQVIDGEEWLFSRNFACPDCGFSFEEIQPRIFSFNNPYGACPTCGGLGVKREFDPDLIMPDKSRSIEEGAIEVWSSPHANYYPQLLAALAEHYHFSTTVPVSELSEETIKLLMYGSGKEKIKVHYVTVEGRKTTFDTTFEGAVSWLERRLRETESDAQREEIEQYMSSSLCPDCGGRRLKKEVLSILFGGLNIAEVSAFSVSEALAFFQNVKPTLTTRELLIAAQILKEIEARLGFLLNVGLDYLTLNRASGTLSGGEAQRIRLATQIGSGLVGVLYILDEPSIGLHQRDNAKLLQTLKHLRDLGNTLIVVEHDEETMWAADHILDIGPGPGTHGGQIVAQGTAAEICQVAESITGQYLSRKKFIAVPAQRHPLSNRWLTVKGARANNLKNIDVAIPLGVFTCVTGVSGSGKSSLVNEIIRKKLLSSLNRAKTKPGEHDEILGMEELDKVIDIDQSPIGRTPRSNPATYTGVFGDIRELFASTNDAKVRGYKSGRFSFNIRGGRCEACKGDGIIKIEMHFLPDIFVPCEVCKGKRYSRETLEVHYKGKSIADVLDMTVEEALGYFQNLPKIARKIQTLYDVGLGYIKLGQPATTLSGGEAQRVKLATELSRRATGRTLYLLDEPTTGLHIADIDRLLEVLHRLVENGDTVVVIEHNLDVIKTADYIIDMGPEGGFRGGEVIAKGTPEEIAACEHSYTGQYLKKILARTAGASTLAAADPASLAADPAASAAPENETFEKTQARS